MLKEYVYHLEIRSIFLFFYNKEGPEVALKFRNSRCNF